MTGPVSFGVVANLYEPDDPQDEGERTEHESEDRDEPEHAEVVGGQRRAVAVRDDRGEPVARRPLPAGAFGRQVVVVGGLVVGPPVSAAIGGLHNSPLIGWRLYSGSGMGRPCGPGRSLCGSRPSPRKTVAATSPDVTGRLFGA